MVNLSLDVLLMLLILISINCSKHSGESTMYLIHDISRYYLEKTFLSNKFFPSLTGLCEAVLKKAAYLFE